MRDITYAQAINEALAYNMEKDPGVFLMGEDIGKYGGIFQVTAGLIDRFGPERVIDTPISEAGFVGAAVGAAMTGMRPVAEIMFLDLTTCAMDMIINQMSGQCSHGAPLPHGDSAECGYPALSEFPRHFRPHPRAPGRCAFYSLRCEGFDEHGHP